MHRICTLHLRYLCVPFGCPTIEGSKSGGSSEAATLPEGCSTAESSSSPERGIMEITQPFSRYSSLDLNIVMVMFLP